MDKYYSKVFYDYYISCGEVRRMGIRYLDVIINSDNELKRIYKCLLKAFGDLNISGYFKYQLFYSFINQTKFSLKDYCQRYTCKELVEKFNNDLNNFYI
jgi:hypothetical protein